MPYKKNIPLTLAEECDIHFQWDDCAVPKDWMNNDEDSEYFRDKFGSDPWDADCR